jgi:hypothetical protein
MALLGQASGGFTESNSALRILHVGVRNTVTQLVADAFTQTNPPIVTTNVTTASGFSATVFGVLSGSIAFSRSDAGVVGGIGGPVEDDGNERPLGIFINTANGLAFTNQPGVASNRGPYVSAQGTYANKLYETKNLDTGAATTYIIGEELLASRNGYLTNLTTAANSHDVTLTSGPAKVAGTYWTIGIVTIAPDSNLDELVYDQRI